MFGAIWHKTLGALRIFDLPLQLPINTNTFQMATIIGLGCKRKKSKKHCQKHADKDILRTCYLVTQTVGIECTRFLLYSEGCSKTCTYANQTPCPGATHREYVSKAEHVSVACINVSVKNAGCLFLFFFLKASVEVEKRGESGNLN